MQTKGIHITFLVILALAVSTAFILYARSRADRKKEILQNLLRKGKIIVGRLNSKGQKS